METAAGSKIVDTQEGPVAGQLINGIAVFKGIPYAAAPVGPLRFRPPEPPPLRHEPFRASQFGFVCPQDETLGPAPGPMGEDCLSLNIWAPEQTSTGLLPVMVWIHGGGFATGAGSTLIYDGDYLARKGVVLVTVNYRLNVFGFLAHPELSAESGRHASGNYGLMDQICALTWVQKNIRPFGGDPGNVTVFGESAGGASIAALMSSKLTSGLFHRAIVQSGGYIPRALRKLDKPNGPLISAETLGIKFAQAMGLTGGKIIEKMRALPAQALSQSWFKTIQNNIQDVGLSGSWMMNHLIIDGHVLTNSPGEIFRQGLQHNIPFLSGTTLDEGTFFQFVVFWNQPDMDGYQNYMERLFGKASRKILNYFNAHDIQDAARAVRRVWDSSFFCGARHLSRSMAAIQPRTFRYVFAMPPKFFLYLIPGIDDWKERFGCYHAAELPYVFHFMSLPGMEPEDLVLSDHITDYWVRFARSGDPNDTAASAWPRYSLPDEKFLILNAPVGIAEGFQNELCDFMDSLEQITFSEQ